ncbi:phage tail spike protein [Streptococcus sp. 11-4097]|uniref:phage tail spike protein n=1 Tax=Streptococcus sp. 11-4097 TaxID=2828286 RepID=UPI001BB0A6BE|nr:phage tail protein [Streptococcus sp. 11-4097]
MIYLTNGNMPLNAAYADEIVQEDNSTYQLSFRFPTSDSLWEQLKEEAFLTADDLHGEQDFVIFEVEKKHGYIQVYANQVFTLLNNYVVSSLSLDQATGSTALSRFAGAITRDNPFSFFSDIEDRHTFNIGSKNAMEAFGKDKHSIIGQWGGDLVRHGYQVRLLKNGGSENESLFMYKKNLSSYQHKTSTKSLKTRITFTATVKGGGEKAPDRKFSVVVDSPLINKYSQIYEDVIEVNDQDVKDEASLRKYGEQYYRTSLCDMMEDSLELEVVGQSDVPVQMFDIVSLFHDVYNLDVRKKITKYTYSPMGKKLKTIGFGQFKSGLANAIGNAVSDAVKGEAQQLQSDFERQLARELKNADLAFDRQKEELVNQFTDGLNAAKARAEEVKRELSDTINQRFESFDNTSIQEAKRRAEEALRNAGASSLLAQEAKRISERARTDITNLQASSQNSLSQIESFKNQYGTKLNEVKSTADGILTKLGTIETYVNKDGQRQERLQRYARDESARQVSAVREQISRDYVGKSTYQEDVRGLERRFSAISTQTNNDIASKIAQYKQTVDGQFASITSQIAGKANQTDFQHVRETSQLYERIIGSNENDISNKVARMALTNQLFQVEVAKAAKGGRNYIRGIKEMRVGSGSWDSGTFRGSGSGSVRTIEVSDSPVSGFNKAVRIISSDPKGQIGVAQDGFEIMPGTYTMSVWIRGSAGQRVRLQNYWWSDDSTGISPEFILKDDKWTYLTFSSERKKAGKLSIGYVYLVNGAKGSYLDILAPQLEEGSIATSARPALEDTEEAVHSVQSQLAGSWSVQNLTSAGALVSQINATNNQILIEAEKIRLKGKTLLDELTAINGYFKRIFVGEGAFAKLNAEIIGSKTITADKLIMDQAMARMFVSSNIFTDMLAAKEAFINKLRSVVVTATLLEGYKGKIGGFQIGTHDNDSSSFWLTGLDQFKVGMSNGRGRQFQTAFWANWGNTWGKPGPLSWYVTLEGKMFCRNDAAFHRVVDFSSTSIINFFGSNNFHKNIEMKGGSEIYGTGRSPRENGKNAVVWWSQVGDGTVKYHIDKASDRRLKENITETSIKALDKINQLVMVAFDFIDSKKHEEIGLIAQDVEAVIPQAISQNPENLDGYLHIDYTALVPYLIKGIQELNQKIEKMEKSA